jgi:hypothetical protein
LVDEAVEPERISGEPEWIERSVDPSAGADPLGLQTITTDRFMPRIAPGILALSDRARYFSFYAFLVGQAARLRISDQATLSHFVKEREYELALAVELCPRQCGAGPNGANAARPEVRRPIDAFERRESVESHLGGYGLYYRSPMRTMTLIAPAGTPYRETVLPVDVLYDERADTLAAAYMAAVEDTEYMRRWFGGSEPVPREVIIEYAARACLCRLDEMTAERDAIRAAILGHGGLEPAADVDARRQAFGLVLRFVEDGRAANVDHALRAAVWTTFEHDRPRGESPWSRTIGRWAALTGRDYTQEAIANIWGSAGPALRAADDGWGIDRAGIERGLLATLGAADFDVLGRTVAVDSSRPTADFRADAIGACRAAKLPDVVRWAVKDGSAMAGLVLLFVLYGRLPSGPDLPSDWVDFARISGDRQPGLLRLGSELERHLERAPTLLETMRWVVQQLVLLPHEWTANSKVPEFTFRFRWEAGRLVFFNFLAQPFGRFGLNDIHARSLTSLALDLGFLARVAGGYSITPDGAAFTSEVFPT